MFSMAKGKKSADADLEAVTDEQLLELENELLPVKATEDAEDDESERDEADSRQRRSSDDFATFFAGRGKKDSALAESNSRAGNGGNGGNGANSFFAGRGKKGNDMFVAGRGKK
jgi:hypothetical protein